MAVERRILSASFANTISIALAATLQLATVPILTAAWGLERYGYWLMLTTLPTYFALSDLGFSSAATSDISMTAARGEQHTCRKTFQSAWVLINSVSLLTIAATIGLVLASNASAAFSKTIQNNTNAIVLLTLYAGVAMNTRLLLGGLQATQNYASATLIHEAINLLQILTVLCCATAGFGFFECSAAMLIVQSTNFFILYLFLRHRVPWLHLGLKHVSLNELKRLWKPAIAAMAIPVALAANLQGMILVAGICISPSAAATFASVRTISRVALQLVGSVNRATMPEFAAASAQGRSDDLAKIVALNLITIVLILAPGALIFALFGSPIVALWTAGHIRPDVALVGWMATIMLLHGIWYSVVNLLLAMNSHVKIAHVLVASSTFSIIAAIPGGYYFGLTGLAMCLATAELACLTGVLRYAWRSQILNGEDIISAFMTRPNWS